MTSTEIFAVVGEVSAGLSALAALAHAFKLDTNPKVAMFLQFATDFTGAYKAYKNRDQSVLPDDTVIH